MDRDILLIFGIPVALVVIVGILATAASPDYVSGPVLTEAGTVYDTCYIPKGHGSDVAVGNTFADGKVGISVTPIDVTIPARHAVVFQCQHGKFVVDGQRGAELYSCLDRGDKVMITYCEVFEVAKGKTNAVNLRFLGATKTKQ